MHGIVHAVEALAGIGALQEAASVEVGDVPEGHIAVLDIGFAHGDYGYGLATDLNGHKAVITVVLSDGRTETDGSTGLRITLEGI